MAYSTKIGPTAAVAACDAIVDLLDSGGAGKIEIWEGTEPAYCDTSISDGSGGYNLLAELTLSATAFGAAADQNPNGRATASSITNDSSANKSGTAGFFRAKSGGGTVIIQGLCGTSGSDMNLNTTSIVSGATVSITSWTFTVPEA